MTIVLSFNSLLVISMDGMVPDMARGLVVTDIVRCGGKDDKDRVVGGGGP